MQELDVQPTNPTPYTPAGGTYNFNPTPGAGGLPTLSGLSRNMNPMAQQLQAQGRGQDSMLVHMTPDEVNDLQTLAMHSGTTMTINPNTGLPEAGLLGKVFKKLLPSLLGAGLMFIPGVNAIAAAGIVGGGSTLLTGSLKKGLMAGLQAYGGASLARGLGAGVKAASSAVPGSVTGTGVGSGAGTGISATRDAVGIGSKFGAGFGGTPGVSAFAPGAAGTGLTSAANAGTIAANTAKTGLAAIPGNFARAAQAGLPGGIVGKAAPMLAASGLLSTAGNVADATRTPGQGPVDQNNWPQEGPYMPVRRTLAPRLTGPEGRGEMMFFDQPDFGGYLTASGELRGLGALPAQQSYASEGLTGFAEGGDVDDTAKPRAAYLDVFDASLKELGTLNDTQKKLAEQLRLQISNPMGAVESATGRAARMSLPQLHDVAASVMLQLRSLPGHATNTPTSGTRLTLDNVPRTPPPGTPTPPPPPDVPRVQPPPPPGTPTPPPGGGGDINPDKGGVIPGTGTGATVSQPTLSPGATASGYGAEVLKEVFTPRYTKIEDFVTTPAKPYTGGTEQTAKLADYISSYQTSPGAITAPLGYAPGQSPSQRNRAYAAELARQAEARRKAEEEARRTATTTGTTGQTYGIPDYSTYVYDPMTGTYGPPVTGPNRARGGGIHMDDGAFVVDARTVSELGNGSSSAGQELLARLGGRPVKGPGDGVSDSIRANIGGRQEARVARDEVIFPAAAVKKLGGAKKLYALMDKAHKARKKAGRGSDTQLRKGLGAL